MKHIEIKNKDHNYSEVKLRNLQHATGNILNICDNDIKTKLSILEQTKQELKKYCRTCAGLKLPLVDIFSEKGNQMRLSQQIRHLEDINHPSTSKENNENVPKMSARFSLKDDKVLEKNVRKVNHKESESKVEVEIFEESTILQNSDDNESIEEFDPDDPPFQPDSSDVAESDDEIEIPNAKRRHIQQKENCNNQSTELHSIINSETAIYNTESTKECSKQPNILKRRLLLQSKKESAEETDENCQSNISDKCGSHKDLKVQKLDVNNSLNKRTKKSEIREQIIEEQIEEYKKKREKVLGGHANIVALPKLEESRCFKRIENQDNQRSLTVESDSVVNVQFNKDDGELNATTNSEDDIFEISESAKEKSANEKTYVNTEEYLSHLAKLKLKWEEAKKKKESLQKELDESYTEGNIEKLTRILGEKEKNLQDFQDYLKQRKIVITRLKDEDIISLYEDRNNAVLKNSLPDLIDESQPADYIPEEHYLECDYCPETFASKEVLEEHLKMHDYKIMHFCEDCMEEFPTNKAKRNHNVICMKKLVCKYCNMMLDSKGKKRQHEQKHCDSMYGQLCDVCGEKFKHQGTLDQHVKTQHMSWEKIYQCPKCPKKFAFKQKLSFHLKSVHTTLRAYLCEDCGADFKNPASLRHHRIRKHQPVDCELTFTSEVRLRHHMMITHNRLEGTLPCPHCPKRFVNQLRLKTHMISHSEERPYTCEICGFNLKTKIQLIKHHQNRHSDERPLQCRYCPWRCKQVSALVCHERTHTNERPYSCSVCRQRFKYLGDKNKHERRHESLGGSGFKRIVLGRNIKATKVQEDSSCSEHEQESLNNTESQVPESEYQEQTDQQFEEEQIVKFEEEQIVKFEEEQIVKFEEEQIVKFEEQEITEEYEQVYEQEYEETSREASDAAEVIMNMEDTTVYTEEVTTDNIEPTEIMTDEIMTNEILQSGAVVHLQQEDDSGKIQVIPVMLSLPDLSDANTEVNLATASIMYNN
ncbi:Zinc finger and SCAN domain-containing protein 12 [Melipona quadrifasciata]|uniref:Zinc finger and SCAN domain-containing protein 12 n=1 Tax=Melipona quadrifasciata TaxID=166423 RepID=A0A0M8ZQS0_9HYME|nr:Zinc finger and SCAN domain-containing protein 12 [Melipona quadrifasciata]